ncbi:macro domain-containing protein [Acidithiobacillus ferriphilus]|uniref:macro domain-containing protein n=1 Tax=Acidithiobacillus ferriphilus TaxID=1689834 RepID=UPI002DC02313|nr:macro domain-containing protein [Acidithiobacillus ferriphilus]MEB8473938.1 DUF6430 domain-containing protein [Acidithiobacillus ferriphilus]
MSRALAIIRYLSLKALASSILQAFGVLWLVVEISSFFSPQFSTAVKSFWWLFVAIGIAAGFYRAWPRLSVSARVQGTDCTITIQVRDMFSLKNVAFVIGSNTTFDTALDDGTIAETSVQGQAAKRFYGGAVNRLDEDIVRSLASIPSQAITKPYGKQVAYPIGTVACVSAAQARLYLVAIAALNEHRVAQSSRKNVTDALPLLWESIRTRGGLDSLAVPVLGSGLSRIDATREEIIREIIRSFIPAIRAGNFCRSMAVVVSPADFTAGHVNLQELGAFMHHECMYGSSASAGALVAPVGTPQR